MGETISYSSGKVPESKVDRLVREARERLEKTEGKKGAMWPAAIGYTEAAMYCRWHREDVRACLSALKERGRENERLQDLLLQNGINPEDGEPE